MTSIDDLHHDLKEVSDNVLGDLDTEERIRMYAKAVAEDRMEWLTKTAPTKTYTMPGFEA